MRPVSKQHKIDDAGLPLTYRGWRDAKHDLETEIGKYCSYCERPGYRSALDVEHILPKAIAKFEHLSFRWDNFLLACKNCNSIKGSKEYNPDATAMPHKDNLLLTVSISEGGNLSLKDGLLDIEAASTFNFFELTGVNRNPAHPLHSRNNDRWEARMKTWDIAQNFLKDYKNHEIRQARVIEMALTSGFWSIWMTVFQDFPEIKAQLIKEFPGTATEAFDENLNYKHRNLTQI